MSDKIKNVAKKVLLAFVLVTIGFALGKEFTRRSMQKQAATAGIVADTTPVTQGNKVNVYYAHASYRCATCNEIERLTKKVMNNEFAAAVRDGRLSYQSFNFQQNEKLAKKFNVAAGCVVVEKIDDGKTTDYEVLNGVWTLYSQPDKFNQYIAEAVRKCLNTQ